MQELINLFCFDMRSVAEAKNSANYDEFYDDDEKELIASIEKNFVTLSPPVLPGSVI